MLTKFTGLTLTLQVTQTGWPPISKDPPSGFQMFMRKLREIKNRFPKGQGRKQNRGMVFVYLLDTHAEHMFLSVLLQDSLISNVLAWEERAAGRGFKNTLSLAYLIWWCSYWVCTAYSCIDVLQHHCGPEAWELKAVKTKWGQPLAISALFSTAKPFSEVSGKRKERLLSLSSFSNHSGMTDLVTVARKQNCSGELWNCERQLLPA